MTSKRDKERFLKSVDRMIDETKSEIARTEIRIIQLREKKRKLKQKIDNLKTK